MTFATRLASRFAVVGAVASAAVYVGASGAHADEEFTDYEVVRVPFSLDGVGSGISDDVSCPEEKKVIGGGASVDDRGDRLAPFRIDLLESGPTRNETAWAVTVRNTGGSVVTGNLYAICADVEEEDDDEGDEGDEGDED